MGKKRKHLMGETTKILRFLSYNRSITLANTASFYRLPRGGFVFALVWFLFSCVVV